jgi:hypothetical protein
MAENERPTKHVRAVWDVAGNACESQTLADFDKEPLLQRAPDHYGVYWDRAGELEWIDDYASRTAAEQAAKLSPGVSIVDRVRELIESDDYDQTDLMVATYQNTSPEVQTKIDEVFVCLCGYSLATLIKEAGHG